jgi:kynurenine formamidase/SAM-dependent methyltransferase
VRSFDELAAEAEAADVTGWGFEWLDGRAIEQRPPWGYARLLAARLASVGSALDLDTGGGEVLAEAPDLPARICATEAWPPNVVKARRLLGLRGVDVRPVEPGAPLPFPDRTFELVTSRHPVRPQWEEIHRVLLPGGRYLAQHVGPESARELTEFFLGPQPAGDGRDPGREVVAATAAGLAVTDLRTARCRMEFYDVGAVVWILRKCVWWVPGFSVDAFRERLRDMDATIRRDGRFVAHSSRHLIEAVREPSAGRSGRLVELSHTIAPGMVTYPGLPGPQVQPHLTREASRAVYASGTEFEIDRVTMLGNTGTYLDSPFHRYPDGDDLGRIPLSTLADLPALVVSTAGSGVRAVDVDALAELDVRGAAVLLHTGGDASWGAPGYAEDAPFLTRNAARWLADHGAALVGIDAVNVDDVADPSRPAHTILLGAGIPVVEHLTGLGQLPPSGARFTAAPPLFSGMGTFPVRAFAVLT